MSRESPLVPVSLMDELIVSAPLSALLSLIPDSSPFSYYVWEADQDPITREEVDEALLLSKTNPHHYPGIVGSWTRQQHIERIAYLILNPTVDPLDLDIGAFSSIASLHDGHHRLAAAIHRNDSEIRLSLSGDIDRAEKAFGITIK